MTFSLTELTLFSIAFAAVAGIGGLLFGAGRERRRWKRRLELHGLPVDYIGEADESERTLVLAEQLARMDQTIASLSRRLDSGQGVQPEERQREIEHR